jgi:hypothetical protein
MIGGLKMGDIENVLGSSAEVHGRTRLCGKRAGIRTLLFPEAQS